MQHLKIKIRKEGEKILLLATQQMKAEADTSSEAPQPTFPALKEALQQLHPGVSCAAVPGAEVSPGCVKRAATQEFPGSAGH